MVRAGAVATNRFQLLLASVLLVMLVAFIVLQGEAEEPRPFDPASSAPTGLRALWLWLEEMAFTVVRNDGATFAIPDTCAVIFVFPNQQPYTPEEATQLAEWVAAGGTLVLVGASPFDQALLDTFLVATEYNSVESTSFASQSQPLLPDLTELVYLSDASTLLDLKPAPAAIPILVTGTGQATLAIQPWQRGIIWHASIHHSFTNELLRYPEQAAIVPALLRHAAPGGRILFDTYHLFGADTSADNHIQTLQDWLYSTALGRSVLFALAVTLLFVMLQGWRLGPPLPTREELRRREAAEYVTAMANLLRRGQQRAFVAAHHKRRLKRTLGRALNVSPDLADSAFLHQVQQADERLSVADVQQLATLFQSLGNPTNEQGLTQAVSQIDPFMARYRRHISGN